MRQGAFAVLDLRTAFQIDPNWEVGLNINHVLDETCYESIHGPTASAWYGEPRNLMLRIEGRF